MSSDRESPRRQLAAVWFADIAGFTSLASRSEDEAMSVVEVFQDLARKAVDASGGRIVKFLGDGVLATFESLDTAVRAALELSRSVEGREPEGLPRFRIRVGVHLGDVITAADGDVYGDGVNTASRLQSTASEGQVVVSEDVWRQLRNRPEFALEELGQRRLKGLPGRVRVFGVTEAGTGPVARAAAAVGDYVDPSRKRRSRNLAFLGFGILIALVAVGLTARYVGDGAEEPGNEATRSAEGEPLDRSVAVLPFENLSPEPENEYFADGMTEEILATLALVEDLKVISRTSVMQYKGTTKTIRQIGEELEVATVLEGSVRRAGDRVRVTAQLIEASSDEHLWANTYDREMVDIFEIQSEIAASIAEALQAKLSPRVAERLAEAPTADIEAYDIYLRGNEYFNRLTPRDNTTAMMLYRRALEEDPGFALAQAGLGNAYAARAAFGINPADADSAVAAGRRAIELDPNLAEGHTAVGLGHLVAQLDEEAFSAFEEAIALKPNSTLAAFGISMLSRRRGDLVRSLRWALRAAELEPTTAHFHAAVAWSYIELDDMQSAREWARKALALQPDLSDGHLAIGMIALVEGDYEVARKQAARILELEVDRTDAIQFAGWVELMAGDLDAAETFIVRLEETEVGRISDIDPAIDRAYLATVRGRPGEAREILRGFAERLGLRLDPAQETRPRPGVIDRVGPHVHWELAAAHAILGNTGRSVRELARARENGWLNYHSTRLPFFDSVRDDPRFVKVVNGMRADVRRMRQLAEAEGL